MHTGHILDEINKLTVYAKWDDKTLADLIEGFAELEEPDLSPLPELVDKLHQQGASAKQRVDTYLCEYFRGLSDEEVSILVYLSGELPERDMTTLKEGDTAYWLDPGDHLGNGWYTISRIGADDELSTRSARILSSTFVTKREARPKCRPASFANPSWAEGNPSARSFNQKVYE